MSAHQFATIIIFVLTVASVLFYPAPTDVPTAEWDMAESTLYRFTGKV